MKSSHIFTISAIIFPQFIDINPQMMQTQSTLPSLSGALPSGVTADVPAKSYSALIVDLTL
jgi:hypothetical protein